MRNLFFFLSQPVDDRTTTLLYTGLTSFQNDIREDEEAAASPPTRRVHAEIHVH